MIYVGILIAFQIPCRVKKTLHPHGYDISRRDIQSHTFTYTEIIRTVEKIMKMYRIAKQREETFNAFYSEIHSKDSDLIKW